MVFIKFSQHQLNTLRELPQNLNSLTTSHNIGGIMILNKAQEIKQIILDFQSYHIDELYTSKKDNKVHLSNHIKGADPRTNYTLTFEIENIIKKKENKSEFSCFSVPDIFQWIKCIIHSIYRDIYNHIVFTGSGKIFVISLKRNHYNRLLRMKLKDNIKIKEMYHILMKEYLDIYHEHKIKYKSFLSVPAKLEEIFNVKEFNKNDSNILFDYSIHNPVLVKVTI
tara:strand:- start:3163 stop:3834 length:672 start_codon:yes stop_codon:yes gene_type:complete